MNHWSNEMKKRKHCRENERQIPREGRQSGSVLEKLEGGHGRNSLLRRGLLD